MIFETMAFNNMTFDTIIFNTMIFENTIFKTATHHVLNKQTVFTSIFYEKFSIGVSITLSADMSNLKNA